jgi:hypothetical protein
VSETIESTEDITTAPTPRPRRTDVSRLPLAWAAGSKTKEGELYRRVVRLLREHVGGKPSHTQELLIGRIAWLQVHLAHIDERAVRDGGLSPHATREYLAWSNTIARMTERLGFQPASTEPQSIWDIIRQEQAANATRA